MLPAARAGTQAGQWSSMPQCTKPMAWCRARPLPLAARAGRKKQTPEVGRCRAHRRTATQRHFGAKRGLFAISLTAPPHSPPIRCGRCCQSNLDGPDGGNPHRRGMSRWLDNRAGNSHLPLGWRERAVPRFRRMKSLQKSVSVHAGFTTTLTGPSGSRWRHEARFARPSGADLGASGG